VKFRLIENAVEGVLERRWSSSARVGRSVMADVLALSSSSYKLATRILQAPFLFCCAIGFLGCNYKKILLPKVCVSLENNY
jgi:hypothetical protein